MGDTSSDPVDHARTTRKQPGLLILAVAILAVVVALAAFAASNASAGLAATAVAAVCLLAGGGWLFTAHRRVRKLELRWLAAHPQADAQPPAS